MGWIARHEFEHLSDRSRARPFAGGADKGELAIAIAHDRKTLDETMHFLERYTHAPSLEERDTVYRELKSWAVKLGAMTEEEPIHARSFHSIRSRILKSGR